MQFIVYFWFFCGFKLIVSLFMSALSYSEVVVILSMAVIFSYVGLSFNKRKQWAWWTSLIFFCILFVNAFDSVWLTIILPIFEPNVTGVGVGRWVTLGLLALYSVLIFILLEQGTRKAFNVRVAAASK